MTGYLMLLEHLLTGPCHLHGNKNAGRQPIHHQANHILIQRHKGKIDFILILVDSLDQQSSEVIICLPWIKWMGQYPQKWNPVEMIPKIILVTLMCLILLTPLKAKQLAGASSCHHFLQSEPHCFQWIQGASS